MLTAANAAAQKTLLNLTKSDVGLGSVDNTSDVNKPVSTAQQTAIDAKIGGTVGTTTNRLTKSSGTGGSTLQASGITVDASNNMTGVVAITTAGVATLPAGSVGTPSLVVGNAGSGWYSVAAGTISFAASGTTVFLASAITGNASFPKSFRFNSTTFVGWSSGNPDVLVDDAGFQRVSAGVVGVKKTAGGDDGDLTAGNITASALLCCGVYTFATVPSASSNTGKFLRISDRAQKHAYSDGTNWRFFGDDVIIS
jgi:hypothetical protein